MRYKFMIEHGGYPNSADNIDYWGHKVEGDYFVCVIEADTEEEACAEYELGFDDVIELS